MNFIDAFIKCRPKIDFVKTSDYPIEPHERYPSICFAQVLIAPSFQLVQTTQLSRNSSLVAAN